MSIDQEEIVPAVTQESLEPAVTETAPAPLSIEDKARAMGWKPLDEFKGDPDVWTEPKEFVSRKSFFVKIDDLKKVIQKQEQVIKTISQTMGAAEQRAYEKAVQDTKAQMAEARLAGDFDMYEDAVAKQTKLAQQGPIQIPNSAPGPITDPRDAPEWKEFAVQNTWVDGTDVDSRIKQQAAFIMIKDFRDANPGCEFSDVTKHIHNSIRAKFPNDFKTPHTPNVSGVARGSSGGDGDSGQSKYVGLTTAQRQALEYYEERKLDTKTLMAQFRKGK